MCSICMRLRPQLPHSVIFLNESQALFRCRRSRSLSCAISSQRRISSSRKRHCLPTFRAGISPHSAQKHTVREDTPNHRATVAVERNGSCCSPLRLRITERLQKKFERCDDSSSTTLSFEQTFKIDAGSQGSTMQSTARLRLVQCCCHTKFISA